MIEGRGEVGRGGGKGVQGETVKDVDVLGRINEFKILFMSFWVRSNMFTF